METPLKKIKDKNRYRFGTVAYVINRRGMEKILNEQCKKDYYFR